MRYRIEYSDNRHCDFANSRKDLLQHLTRPIPRHITDIRKLYKSGSSDSVFETYKKYIYAETKDVEFEKGYITKLLEVVDDLDVLLYIRKITEDIVGERYPHQEMNS